MRHTRLLCLLTAVLIALTACTSGSDDPPDPDSDPRTAATDLRAPLRSEMAAGVRLGDQTEQFLYDVARNDGAVVAVGTDSSTNMMHPLLLHSPDGGDSWQRSVIAPASRAEVTTDSWTYDVAAGPDVFVASGGDLSGDVRIWTSRDGASWELADTGLSFHSQDSVSAVEFAEGRFWMVGTNSRGAGRATQRIVLWSSTDGQTWERSDLSDELPDLRGTPSVHDVAVRGRTVLIAAGVEDNALDDQPNRLLFLRSLDGGTSFTADRTPEDLGGDFRAYAYDLTVDDGRFQLAVQGDGTSQERFGGQTWDSVVLRERSDRRWTQVSPSVFSTRDDDMSPSLLRGPEGWVMTAGVDTDRGRETVVALGDNLDGLARLSSPTTRGPGDQHIRAGVADDTQVLLVGGTARSGSLEAAIWRVRNGKVTELDLPAEARGSDPSVSIGTVLRTAEGFVVSGTSAGSPVVWTSKDFESWTTSGLPGRTPKSTVVAATGGTTLGDGTPLLLGQRSLGNGTDATSWRQGSNGKWTSQVPPGFTNRGDSGYGTVNPTDAATDGDTTVIAANSYVNGQGEAHPLVSTDAGRTWSAAVGRDARPAAEVSDFFGNTPWREFVAPDNGSISMNAVARTSRGWLIAGGWAEADQRSEPVVWRSSEGGRWTGPSTLPLPEDAWSANISDLAVDERSVVALGPVSRSEDDKSPTWVSWVSDDGGKTFTVGTAPEEKDANAWTVLATPGGFLALGALGPDHDVDARAWQSIDGALWEPIDLGTARAEGPGSQGYVDALVDDDRLRVVGRDIDREGVGGYYTFTVPLRAG